MEKVQFTLSDNEKVAFFVLEQTRINGIDYLLVTDSEEEEAQAWILKDVSAPQDEEDVYVIVEDDQELSCVSGIFQEELEDIEII